MLFRHFVYLLIYISLVLHFSFLSFLLYRTMESGLPMLNCLLQHTLKSLCSFNSDSYSSRWVYAVFWRILPRNYPPPKWDQVGDALDRAKGNKRNWILVWEDGFCDFCECERAGNGYVKGRFGADVFFKMSHEVYNYGEGLVGKVAADNSHKWVFSDSPNENDPCCSSSWNASIDIQPRAWEVQFSSGIQTIAVISVREGIVQLGSLDKMVEDLNLVTSIQRKFNYLQSIPGTYAMQRPYLPIQHPYSFKPDNPHMMIESSETAFTINDNCQLRGLKRMYCERQVEKPLNNSMNFSYIGSQNAMVRSPPPLWSIPPLLPSISYNVRALSSKLPLLTPSTYNATVAFENSRRNSISQSIKFDDCVENHKHALKLETSYAGGPSTHQETSSPLNTSLGPGDNAVVQSEFRRPISKSQLISDV